MRRLAILVGLATAGLALSVPAVRAQSPEVTEIRILDADGDPLEGGGSDTPFALELPDGAACPGDTADDFYVANTYMVAASRDVLDITFNGLGPDPWQLGSDAEFQHPLFDVDTASIAGQPVADAEEPGGPGVILPLPMFSLGIFTPGDIPPGRYSLGVNCTLRNEIERVWNAQIEVTEDAGDEPAGVRWEVVGFQPDDEGSSSAPIALGVGLALVAVVVVVLVRRQKAAPPPGRKA